MKVRTKLALLLLIVVGTSIGGLAAIKTYDWRKFRKLNAQYEEERQKSFDGFIERWTRSLEVFARDCSCWDETVAALAEDNREWAKQTLGEAALTTHRANAIWVYKSDGQYFHSVNNLYSDDALREAPIPREAMIRVMNEKKLYHFFAATPLGLFEIRGATIHPSRDSARVTPPHGYLFVGHFWSREDLKDVSLLTGHTVDIVPVTDSATPDVQRIGLVTFTREFPGWEGRPLVKFMVRNDSPMLEQLHGSSERQFLWLILFAAVVFLLLLAFLNYWVNQPIRALSKCLRTQSLEPIRGLQSDPCEFGDFARLIRDFFQQRESLLREIAERQVTEKALLESEERLRHSQKMEAVGQLAGGIAHDFNNLLTAIIGYAELIVNRSVPGEPNQEDADQIAKAGEQAAALTRQLLAFSRKQILQPRVIDLNALTLETQKLLERVIGEHINLRVEAAATDARVRADPNQMEQVILNLGVNGRDAMPGGGVLTIRTANTVSEQTLTDGSFSLPPGRYVTLTVQDSGHGMDAETRERIFEPFFTTKGPAKGTGLGLATVYGIVQQSGGAIEVRSTPGEGTAFTIYMPLESAPLDVPKIVTRQTVGSRNSETVLVVEDDETVRELVCAVLAEQGYCVLCASHGTEALQMANDHSGEIDLLLSDVVMPQMHGPQLARELLLVRPNTKVLFVSGYSDTEISNQGILDPEVRFLEKPFTPEALGRKVREVLDESAVPAVA